MTNEEAVKIIESVGPDSSVYGWRKVADALNLAITALQNQSKYERALDMAIKDGDKAGVDIYCAPAVDGCPYSEDGRLSYCCECGTAYYKHKAGIEDDAE